MRRAVLVIDMPDTCGRCQLCQGVAMDGEHVCSILDEDGNERGYDDGGYGKPDWCPLKAQPRMKFTYIDHDDDETANYNRGWNDCIDKILNT